jgi:hypothetical protein
MEATWITARNFARPSVITLLYASTYKIIDVTLPPVTCTVHSTLVPGVEYGTYVAQSPFFPDSCTPVNRCLLNPITITASSYYVSLNATSLIVCHDNTYLFLDTVSLNATTLIASHVTPLIDCHNSNCLFIDTITRTCHAALSSTVTWFDYLTVLTNAEYITPAARTHLLSAFSMSSMSVNLRTFSLLTLFIKLIDTSYVFTSLFCVDNT